MTSKVENIYQKRTFTQTDHRPQLSDAILFFILTVTEWNAQDCGIPKAAKDTSMLPSKMGQMKASQETGT